MLLPIFVFSLIDCDFLPDLFSFPVVEVVLPLALVGDPVFMLVDALPIDFVLFPVSFKLIFILLYKPPIAMTLPILSITYIFLPIGPSLLSKPIL